MFHTFSNKILYFVNCELFFKKNSDEFIERINIQIIYSILLATRSLSDWKTVKNTNIYTGNKLDRIP